MEEISGLISDSGSWFRNAFVSSSLDGTSIGEYESMFSTGISFKEFSKYTDWFERALCSFECNSKAQSA